jgi:hypothetical protein
VPLIKPDYGVHAKAVNDLDQKFNPYTQEGAKEEVAGWLEYAELRIVYLADGTLSLIDGEGDPCCILEIKPTGRGFAQSVSNE